MEHGPRMESDVVASLDTRGHTSIGAGPEEAVEAAGYEGSGRWACGAADAAAARGGGATQRNTHPTPATRQYVVPLVPLRLWTATVLVSVRPEAPSSLNVLSRPSLHGAASNRVIRSACARDRLGARVAPSTRDMVERLEPRWRGASSVGAGPGEHTRSAIRTRATHQHTHTPHAHTAGRPHSTSRQSARVVGSPTSTNPDPSSAATAIVPTSQNDGAMTAQTQHTPPPPGNSTKEQ